MDNRQIEILLIEDNAGDAEMTIRALKKNNISNNLVHLKDGAEAMEFFFDNSNPNPDVAPKLILLDLKMPKVDGLEVLRQLKASERTKTIPIVVLTSSKEDPDIRKCYELGVNSYIVKPVGFDSFVEVVSKLGLYWMLLNQAPK